MKPEYADLAERVAKAIISQRNYKGYTLEKLAVLAHIPSPSTLARMESGDQLPDLEQAIRIALALDLNPCEFYEGLYTVSAEEPAGREVSAAKHDIPSFPRSVIVTLILERGFLSDPHLRTYVLKNIHRLEDDELAGVLMEVVERSQENRSSA